MVRDTRGHQLSSSDLAEHARMNAENAVAAQLAIAETQRAAQAVQAAQRAARS